MKYSVTFAAAAAFASLAVAQDLSGIPECAVDCIKTASAETPCAVDDYACQCEPANMATISGAAVLCVSQACSTEELSQTLAGTKQLCDSLADLPEPTDTAPEPTDTAPEPTDTAPEPTDTAPEPTDTAPEPTDTAPEPTDTAPEPTDTAPEPTDTAPEPTDTAPEPTDGGAPVAPETVYVTVCATETPEVPVPTGPAPTGVVPTGNGTSPTGPPTPTFTGGADKLVAGLGSVVALAVAALAL